LQNNQKVRINTKKLKEFSKSIETVKKQTDQYNTDRKRNIMKALTNIQHNFLIRGFSII
jgi:CII-binding regulator of phage lambda lysogenization HflD